MNKTLSLGKAFLLCPNSIALKFGFYTIYNNLLKFILIKTDKAASVVPPLEATL